MPTDTLPVRIASFRSSTVANPCSDTSKYLEEARRVETIGASGYWGPAATPVEMWLTSKLAA